MKSLVVYYSRRGENYAVGNIIIGNAENIANQIKEITGSDIYEIKPLVDYPLNYKETTEVALKELKEDKRPEFKNHLDSVKDYDIIYLCYPNWWGTFPRVVRTFLESYDFKNKVIKPMCTHEGSGLGSSMKELINILPNSIIKEGLAIKGTNANNCKNDLINWINK